MIEKQVLPFIEKRIRNLEISIANTRKGIKNQFKNLWKKAERGENDGLKDNFKMNKEESERLLFLTNYQLWFVTFNKN